MMCMGFCLAPVIHEQCEPSPGSTNTRASTMKYTFIFVFCHFLLRQLYVGCVCARACALCGYVCASRCVERPPGCSRPAFLQSERADCSSSSSPIRCAANVFFCHIRSDAAASFSLARGKHHRRAETQHAFACWATLTHCVHWFQAARVRNPIRRRPMFTSHERFPCISECWDGQSRSWFQQPEQPELYPRFIRDCFVHAEARRLIFTYRNT